MAARPDIELVIKAINETKGVLQEAGQDVKRYIQTVEQENKKTQASFKNVSISLSGVATSALSLWAVYDRLQSASLAVDTAEKTLHKTEVTLAAQRKTLNDLIAKGKQGTEEYKIAADRVAVTEEALEIQTRRVQQAKEDLIKSYLSAAGALVPTLITAISSGTEAYKAFKKATDAATASQASFTASVAAAVGPIGAAIGITAGLYFGFEKLAEYMYDTSDATKVLQEAAKETEEFFQSLEASINETSDSLTDLEKSLNDLTGVFITGADKIKKSYFDVFTEESEAFQEDLKATAEVVVDFLSGMEPSFASVSVIVQIFADQWRITWEEAERIIMKAVATIKEGTDEIAEPIKSVSELIAEGTSEALQKAQDEMQDYVECAGGKHVKMIEDIESDIKDLEAKQKENTDKMELVTAENFDAMARDWLEHGELTKTAIGMTAGEIQKMEELLADNEGWLVDFVDLTEEEKADEVKAWQISNERIHEQIEQLKVWLKELEEAYLAVAAAREEAGVSAEGGASYEEEYAATQGLGGLGRQMRYTSIPEGTYLLEKHSPGIVTPITIPGGGGGEISGGGRSPPTAGGTLPSPIGGGRAQAPQNVYITAAPQITVNVTGPVQPAVIPVLARETKKAAYEGVSEVLRDELRRKGIPIWTGE